VIDDDSFNIMGKGCNEMFYPFFNSGAHAEMQAINAAELNWPKWDYDKYPATLYTTLEPCPMCFTRFLSSKIKSLNYITFDPYAGMIETKSLECFPRIWKELAKHKSVKQVNNINEDLRMKIGNVFYFSKDKLDKELLDKR
jgi:cytosine deaminase